MRVRWDALIETAIEHAVQPAWRRVWKHVDNPPDVADTRLEELAYQTARYALDWLCEYVRFDDDDGPSH